MKTIKKGLALLLALMMMLSLTACDNLQTLKTVRKIQKLESYHADCSVDMNMGLGMLGQSLMNLEFHIGADADTIRAVPFWPADPFREASRPAAVCSRNS